MATDGRFPVNQNFEPIQGTRHSPQPGAHGSRLSPRSDDPLYWCAATAAIGRILLENGYRTSRFGKDHNTPTWTASQAGLFDQWPSGMGFEYFYGFVGGDASQWEPNLFRNTTAAIYPG